MNPVRSNSRNMESRHKSLEIIGPAYCDCDVADRVFDYQVPADYPCDHFAERCIRVGVGRTRYGNHRSELGITERRKSADDCGDDERYHQRRPCAGPVRVARRSRADSSEYASADDRADAEQRQLNRAERAVQLVLRLFGVFQNRIE